MMKDEKILQLKISLDGIEPQIWRRFLVEDSITFRELHKIIQKIMGWEDYHLYNFQIGDLCIEGEEEGMICVDAMWRGFRPKTKSQSAKKTKLNKLITKEKQKFGYVYDLGDCWEHSIVVKKIMGKEDGKNYPVCIAGERACPPEDCGGAYGYRELMKIRQNKNHPEYKERIVEWLGEDYDPKLFVIDWVNARLKGKHPVPVWVPNKKKRKLGRNEPCHCGSGEKYKKCCLDKDIEKYGRPIKVDY